MPQTALRLLTALGLTVQARPTPRVRLAALTSRLTLRTGAALPRTTASQRQVLVAGARTLIVAALIAPALGSLPAATPAASPPAPTLAQERTLETSSRSAERAVVAPTVTVTDAGVSTTYTAPPGAVSIADALRGTGVILGEHDQMTPNPSAQLPASGDTPATITRISVTLETVDTSEVFTTRTVEDPQRPAGSTQVIQAGQNGLTRTTYTVLRDPAGTEISRELYTTAHISSPVEQVTSVGTKPAPAAAQAPAARAVEPGTARAIAQDKVAARGWGAEQFSCLDALWTKESGWSTTANNPSSSAYGIPQALPGSKMASAGADWATNPATQIDWGLGYIAGRYTTPCGAWEHSTAKGWY